MKKFICLLTLVTISCTCFASSTFLGFRPIVSNNDTGHNEKAENPFLEFSFWQQKPSIAQIEEKIKEGHSITAKNDHAFDAVTIALMTNNPTKTIIYIIEKGNDVNKITHHSQNYIFYAAAKGDIPLMKYLIKKGSKLDIIDSHGYSIFLNTVNSGVQDTKVYDFLISQGFNVTTDLDHNGKNAILLLASKVSDFKLIDYFIKKGLDLNSVDKNGNGIFHYAAQGGNVSFLKQLVAKGVNYKANPVTNENAIYFATTGIRRRPGGPGAPVGPKPGAPQGRPEEGRPVEGLPVRGEQKNPQQTRNKKVQKNGELDLYTYLESLGLKANITNKNGITPLHNLASSSQNIALIKHFINKGISVDATDNKGNTPLLNAAGRNSLEVVSFLAENSKNINTANKKGQTALIKAITNDLAVIEFLLSKNADINFKDNKGNNISYYLLKSINPRNQVDFVKKLGFLNNKGVNLAITQEGGKTLWHLATALNSLSVLKELTKYQIPLNKKDAEGNTPLHFAAMNAKNTEILEFLLNQGANKKAVTSFDETAYDLALENELLQKNKVSLDFLK